MPSIDLTPANSLLVQLSQEKRARLVAEANAMVAQANRMIEEAEGTLRVSIERVLREGLAELPNAKVQIKNGDDGAPARLEWEEAAPTQEPGDDIPALEGDVGAAPVDESAPVEAAPAVQPKRPQVVGAGRPLARPAVPQKTAK